MCAIAHPSFSDAVNVHPERYRLASTPTFASYARSRDGGLTAGDVEGQFHMVWPAIKVNVMPGRPNLSVGPLLPAGADRADGFLDYFFAPGEDAAWIDAFLELDHQVGAEDRVLVESVQRGMASGILDLGRLLLPSEELIAEFRRWVAGRLDGGLTPGRAGS